MKRLHLSATSAAHRELAIADDLAGRQLRHVVPILDCGQDPASENYFVVMPAAETSLQAYVESAGVMSSSEVIAVLTEVLDGLREVPRLVHRDLKPGNILRLDGRWCIADFGIARFVEESTSLQTLKDCLSPHFAAPEQWLYETATSATDVYALGCIAHVLLKGHPPFSGSTEELRVAHILGAVPQLASDNAQLNALVGMLLRKEPTARPSIDRARSILQSAARPTPASAAPNAVALLAAAAASYEEKRSATEAARAAAAAEERARSDLAKDAHNRLAALAQSLWEHICEAVPGASQRTSSGTVSISVGDASLHIVLDLANTVIPKGSFRRCGWDVVCGSAIRVTQGSPHWERSASLWFTRKTATSGEFRWLEAGYEGNPLTGHEFRYQPSAATVEQADGAHWSGMDVVQCAYPPIYADDEDAPAFFERWIRVLAAACRGELARLPKRS